MVSRNVTFPSPLSALRLSVLDSDAQMATTVVSLNIEPPSGRQGGGATTIYDSRRMPVVKLSGYVCVHVNRRIRLKCMYVIV